MFIAYTAIGICSYTQQETTNRSRQNIDRQPGTIAYTAIADEPKK